MTFSPKRSLFAGAAFLLLLGAVAWAGEVIPPAPTQYFNDYAHLVPPEVAERLNRTLEDFERRSSDQIVVAIYPKMQSDSSIEDYTVRVARAWKVGRKKTDNGAVLFVFVQEHRVFIATGYGLEGALPDALCKRIIDEQITPRFRSGDYAGGLTAGVDSMIAAVRGEYHGNGQTVAEQSGQTRGFLSMAVIVVLILLILGLRMALGGPGRMYRGRGTYGWGGWSAGGWGGWGGGGWGGGSSGGGFSGGGGSFGGGGAGGSW